MEPFPTSVFNVFIEISATATKICTRGRSTRRLRPGFVTDLHACLLVRAYPFAFGRWGMGSSLERHPFSGLVHSAGELLHAPYRFALPMTTFLLSTLIKTF